jgi:hypothetical protein
MFFLYTLFSFQPVGYRLITLILYSLTAFGLYLVGRKILRSSVYGFMTAVVFLLLPAHFENTYWIATISLNLVALFIIWGTWAFVKFRENMSFFRYLWVIIFGLLAVFSYEQGVVYPLLLLATDILVLKRKWEKKDMLVYIPLGLLDIVYLSHVAPIGGDYSYSVVHFVPNVIGNFLGYMGLFIVGPVSLPWYTLLRVGAKPFSAAIIIVIIIALVGLGMTLYRNKSLVRRHLSSRVLFGLIWIIIGLLPFLPLGNIAPRYGYVSSFGFCILVGIVFERIALLVTHVYPYAKRTLPLALFILLLGFLISQYAIENKEWEQASSITRKTFTFFFSQHPTLAPNTQLIFVNVPIRKGDAWIFPVGLSDALWFIFHDDTIHIFQVATDKEAIAVRQNLTAEGKTSFIFLYHHDGTISERKVE